MAKLFTLAVLALLATSSATSFQLQLDAKLESRTEKSLLQTWSKTLDGDAQAPLLFFTLPPVFETPIICVQAAEVLRRKDKKNLLEGIHFDDPLNP